MIPNGLGQRWHVAKNNHDNSPGVQKPSSKGLFVWEPPSELVIQTERPPTLRPHGWWTLQRCWRTTSHFRNLIVGPIPHLGSTVRQHNFTGITEEYTPWHHSVDNLSNQEILSHHTHAKMRHLLSQPTHSWHRRSHYIIFNSRQPSSSNVRYQSQVRAIR